MTRTVAGCAAALVVLATALQGFALWSHQFPPLQDLPYHMVRHELEAKAWAGAALPAFYQIEYKLYPNLGADVVLPPLILALSAIPACKVFLGALFGFWLGPAAYLAVGARRGERSGAVAASLFLLPMAAGGLFDYGFLNYYSGLGVAFLALANLVRLWGDGARSIGRVELGLHAALVCVVFLWHLADWTIYMVFMAARLAAEVVAPGGTWADYRKRFARASLLGASAMPALGLFVGYKLVARYEFAVSPVTAYVGWSVRGKLAGLSLIVRSYDKSADLIVCLLVIAAALAWFAPGKAAARRLAVPLSVLVLVLGVYLALPFQLGTTAATDVRMLPAILVAALALLSELPIRRPLLGAALLGCGLVIRHVEIDRAWTRMNSSLEVRAHAFRFLHENDHILPVILSEEWGIHRPERCFIGWAVGARGVFVPDLFTIPGQFVVRSPLSCHGLTVDGAVGPVHLDDPAQLACYDVLWVDNLDGRPVIVADGFDKVVATGALTVWRRSKTEDRRRD